MLEGRERAGYYCLHSLLPGSRLAVAFSNEVQSSPVAVASALATAPSGFRVLALPLQALGWSQPLLQLLHLEHSTTLCWSSFKCAFAFNSHFIKLPTRVPT